MRVKYRKFLAEVLDHGQVSIFLNEKDLNDEPLAIVDVTLNEDKRLILHICKRNYPVSYISAVKENAVLSYISRGYIYIMHASLEQLDINEFGVLKVINIKIHRLRKHFRVDVKIDFSVLHISKIDIKEENVKVAHHIGTNNLSVGGFFFYTSESVSVKGLLQITLDQEKYGIVVAKSKIVRCTMVNDYIPLYGVAVQFIGLSSQESGRVLKYLYSVQRKLLSEGKYSESKQVV